MADTAAFFANKKKKKKAFKFNANKIDASTVTQTVHVYVGMQCLAAMLTEFTITTLPSLGSHTLCSISDPIPLQ